MAVQTVTLLASATSLAPNTYRRPDPNTTPTGAPVPAGVTWYKALINISSMLDPATHFEFRTEFSIDGGTTWFEYGGAGRSGGVGHAKDGTTVLANAGVFVGQDAQNPGNDPLPGSGLSSSLRRARAFLVTSGGTFTLGPITLSVGTPTDTQPATT